MLPQGLNQDQVKELLLNDEKLKAELEGKEIKELIIVPQRLINVII